MGHSLGAHDAGLAGDKLKEKKVTLSRITGDMFGSQAHSLGAHAAGYAGDKLKEKDMTLGIITGDMFGSQAHSLGAHPAGYAGRITGAEVSGNMSLVCQN